MSTVEKFRGCLLGLASGDAVGTTVEFSPRGSFAPVTGMVGGGPFGLQPGEWTDDTSMALCLATSLLETAGFDAKDQMQRYCRWREEGYLSSNGRCFDIGMTVRKSLLTFQQTGEPLSGPADEYSAGNGSIMRLAPVALYYYPDRKQVLHYAAESSRTTHGARECIDACILLAEILFRALAGEDREAILFTPAPLPLESPAIRAIANGGYRARQPEKIRGSGYVVQSLEAALWCFHTTSTFQDAILRAANLGDDADTTAAICGQVAGAFYGEAAIPGEWLDKLALCGDIRSLAQRLYEVKPAT